MKAYRIIWTFCLLCVGLYEVLWHIGPRLVIQVRSLITDPRAVDGDLLVILEAVAMLVFVAAFLAAMSPLVNCHLTRPSGVMTGTLAILLLLGWMAALIVTHYGRAGLRQRLLPGMPYSVSWFSEVGNFAAPECLVIAVISFSIAAVTGKGPLCHIGEFVGRRFRKEKPSA
jgi:hypothetical protein